MPFTDSTVTIYSSSLTLLSPTLTQQVSYATNMTMAIQNLDSSASVFLGDINTSSSNYGIILNPNSQVSIDLAVHDNLYALSTNVSSRLAVLVEYQ